MSKNNKLFSKEIKEKHIIYRFFGIKYSVRNKEYWENIKKQNLEFQKIQDNFDLSSLKNAKELVVFLTPGDCKMSGGVMSIFSLCETSRKLLPNSVCILSTYPNGYTYIKNDEFPNDEIVYRFSQIEKNCKNLEKLIIHIPEYFAKKFYKNLSKKDIKFLKSIKDLQLNIMNQNIELMPKPKKLKDLYKLTNNITQTIAHDRYATQEVCDKWQIPTHLFSVKIDTTKYQRYDFDQKEKTIVISPDNHEYKEKIINKLKTDFPDWNFVTVQNLTFPKYMELISKSYFTITFGEGMDCYFLQPGEIGSIGFAAYNDNFFPDKNWTEMLNVFISYEDMYENISSVIKKLINDKDLYNSTSQFAYEKTKKIYNFDVFENNLERFYIGKYDFYPSKADDEEK